TELSWLLSTVTPMGLLERAHAYKDKIAQGHSADHGLFAYPVLQAADILIYDSDLVPVGQDQKQHVEVTRDMAAKFNNTFGEVFKLPEAYILSDVAVVQGTDGRKMSKSYGNTILIFQEPDELKQQVMGVKTDSRPIEEPKDPESCNVYNLYALVAGEEDREAVAERYRSGDIGYGEAKGLLLEAITEYFAPHRERRAELEADPDCVRDVLKAGAERARAEARKTLDRAREAVGV
ncbi:MAG: tryptophan--tRNA ligase, partial [Armatimonadota bacterium]